MNQTTIDKTKEIFGGVIPADRNEFFKYVLENMDNMDVLSLHNDEYCNSYPDDYIYDNDEYTFCENFGHRNPYEVATMLEGTGWRSSHDYFRFDGYGNIESFDDIFMLHYFDIEKVKIYAQVLEPLEPESDVSKYNAIRVQFVSDGQDTFLAFELKDKTFYIQTEDFEFEETGYNYRVDIERFLEVLNETFEWLNSITV